MCLKLIKLKNRIFFNIPKIEFNGDHIVFYLLASLISKSLSLMYTINFNFPLLREEWVAHLGS